MGYKGIATAHGFRTLFSTCANEAGWNSDVIEKLMKDFAAAGKPMEDHTIRKQSEHLAGEAKKQLMAEVR